MKVSAALLALSIDRGRNSAFSVFTPAPLPCLSLPKPAENKNGPSRDLVEHVVAKGQARVRLERRQGLGAASGQGHLDDREEFRRVRHELRELRGGAHFYVAGLMKILSGACVAKGPERASETAARKRRRRIDADDGNRRSEPIKNDFGLESRLLCSSNASLATAEIECARMLTGEKENTRGRRVV